MPYVSGFDRNQLMCCSWDTFVDKESIARIIDAFVEHLDIKKYGVKAVSAEGRPAYDPKSLYKLYIYGSRKGIRSSRKLAESCRVNLEVKWMTGGIEPDFRTISDFRKDNIDSLKEIFHEFNRRISEAVEWGFSSVDGTKIQANNSKDNNFTKNKLDDRIRWLNGHTDEYLRILNEMDAQEETGGNPGELTREGIEAKLKEARERLARYEGYQKIMEETGASQLSITDADARLMKSKNGFVVAYNAQTAVDSGINLIRDFRVTNQVTDHGLMESTMEGIKEAEPEKLTKALHVGQIREAYEPVIQEIKVETVRRKEPDEKAEKSSSIYGSQEEMLGKAKEGYFVRDPERNLVYCPAGEILRQKCIKKNGNIRYANKNACKHCPNRSRCYKGKGEWKEIDFTKDQLEKPCKEWLKAEGKESEETETKEKWHYEKKKVVKFFLKPNRKKTDQRMCLSEHPFGTIKRTMGASSFLLKGMRKVAGEFALFCLGYNLERAKNLLGFQK